MLKKADRLLEMTQKLSHEQQSYLELFEWLDGYRKGIST